MNRETVIRKLQAIIEAEGTQKAAAEVLGVSQQYLTDLLKGRRDPGAKILTKLGLESRVTYQVRQSKEVSA